MKNYKNILFISLIVILSACNNRAFDIILYDHYEYEKSNPENIFFVKSRLEIKGKYFEIGVIKGTEETKQETIRDFAAQNGADFIIDEGNLNYTLAKFKQENNGENKDENPIKI